MTDIMTTAQAFFETCETGNGWSESAQYCTADAGFPPSPIAAFGAVDPVNAYAKLSALSDGAALVK